MAKTNKNNKTNIEQSENHFLKDDFNKKRSIIDLETGFTIPIFEIFLLSFEVEYLTLLSQLLTFNLPRIIKDTFSNLNFFTKIDFFQKVKTP